MKHASGGDFFCRYESLPSHPEIVALSVCVFSFTYSFRVLSQRYHTMPTEVTSQRAGFAPLACPNKYSPPTRGRARLRVVATTRRQRRTWCM